MGGKSFIVVLVLSAAAANGKWISFYFGFSLSRSTLCTLHLDEFDWEPCMRWNGKYAREKFQSNDPVINLDTISRHKRIKCTWTRENGELRRHTNIKLAEIGLWLLCCVSNGELIAAAVAAVAAHKPYNFVFEVYLLWSNSSHPFRLFFTSVKQQYDRTTWYPLPTVFVQCACIAQSADNGQPEQRTAPKTEWIMRTWCDRRKNQFLIVCLHFWLNSRDSSMLDRLSFFSRC